MTASSPTRTTTLRSVAALSAAGALGVALVGCSPNEPVSNTPGTTPSVITGNQVPPGSVVADDGSPASPTGQAVAEIVDAQNQKVGEATFSPGGSSVRVSVKLDRGLPAGFHAMHIHQNGVCETAGDQSFTSAGGHLQVDGNTGHPSSGDLVSINVLRDGTAETVTTTDSVTLNQIVGKALVIHQNPDNFANIPDRYQSQGRPGPDSETMSTGDGGSRLACGVIKLPES
ncbi:superoxide dismutase family protein [Gordonia sinesedis]